MQAEQTIYNSMEVILGVYDRSKSSSEIPYISWNPVLLPCSQEPTTWSLARERNAVHPDPSIVH